MHSEDTPARVIATLIEEHTELTVTDVCGACAVQIESIVALVDEAVLEPLGRQSTQWRFSGAQLRRAKTAIRLQRDLGVNAAGVALALDLLDEIERLRAKLRAADVG